jgi:hypothetical protein
MLRIYGDRTSLLAALVAHWADHQLQIPPVAPTRDGPRAGLPAHLAWPADRAKPAAEGASCQPTERE